MKKNDNLKTLLEHLLSEAQPVDRPKSMADFAPAVEKPISLDQAIDRYLVQYERESIPTSEVFESSNIKSLMGFLFEQDLEEPADDEEADPAADPAAGEDAPLDVGGADAGGLDLGGGGGLDLGGDAAGGDAAGAGAGGEEKQEPVVNTPQINLQDFTRSVARLVNNAQALINFQTLILNRAEAYIKNNYDERTAKEMMSILDNQWDLRPETVETTANPDTEYPQPHTAVTGPMGG